MECVPLHLSSSQWLLLVLQELVGITLKVCLLKLHIRGPVSPGLWIAHLSGFVLGDYLEMLGLCLLGTGKVLVLRISSL